jgi:ABC-2 type transport system permease protein
MSKTWIILKHEFRSVVTKPSFWFGIIGAPILFSAIAVGIALVSGAATVATIAQQLSRQNAPQGYVDRANIIKTSSDGFEAYRSEEDARQALESGAIEAYYVVAPDYLATGDVRVVSRQLDDSLLGSRQKTAAFEQMLGRNLLGDDDLQARVNQQVNFEERVSVAPANERRGLSLGGFSPLVYGIAILFFIVLMTSSAYLMQAVTTEKENRVIEVLMSSVTPTELLAGKILGLSLVGLIQMALWFGSSLFLLTSLPMLRNVVGPISPLAVLLTVVFFILGYFVYASLLAGLGALMPGSREAAQYTFLVLIPLFIPLYLNTAIAVEPNGALATALSLIPFTSPIVMPMRLFAANVPLLEVVISLMLLAGLVYLAITGAARVFRAHSLLSGAKPTLKQVVAAFRG